jgi:hypothetical protein
MAAVAAGIVKAFTAVVVALAATGAVAAALLQLAVVAQAALVGHVLEVHLDAMAAPADKAAKLLTVGMLAMPALQFLARQFM